MQTESNEFELEGSMDSFTLPRSLTDSIRLRMDTVREQDPSLYTLLSLVAAQVLNSG